MHFLKGLNLLTSTICVCVTLYQAILLLDNFKSKDTIRKSSEEVIHGDLRTPMIIACTDTPQYDTVEEIINVVQNDAAVGVPPVQHLNTVLKVLFVDHVISNIENY